MTTDSRSHLPDFCRLPRIAAVCGITQLAVILLFLSPLGVYPASLTSFLAASAFAQWLALASALLLCKAGPVLSRFSSPLSYALAATLSGMLSALAAWLVYVLDREFQYRALQHLHPAQFCLGTALMMALLSAVMLRYFYVRDQWRDQVRANAKASLQALQARINPHFLFNSMNTIAALVRRDPRTAEAAIEDLSDLFRAALGDENAEATLAEELQIARQYLAIEQLRLGARLRMDWQLAADLPMQIRMPRLTLQPLFENAVIHGIAGLPEGGEIEVVAKAADGRVQLTISNPFPPGNPTVGHGHALDSIRRRLALYYGARASLTETAGNGRFSIRLGIPNEPAA
jgi:two-component system sensor histidine kinase AlgZ